MVSILGEKAIPFFLLEFVYLKTGLRWIGGNVNKRMRLMFLKSLGIKTKTLHRTFVRLLQKPQNAEKLFDHVTI